MGHKWVEIYVETRGITAGQLVISEYVLMQVPVSGAIHTDMLHCVPSTNALGVDSFTSLFKKTST